MLPGPASQDRRGRQRGAGRDPGDPAGAAHDPPQICLSQLHRWRGPGEGAAAPDRERHGLDGARDPRSGFEVRLVSAAVPAAADPGRPGRPYRPGDACRLGEACGLVAQELQLRTIQAAPRVFCDETPMPVLDPGRRRTRICQFWAHAMDDRPWGGPSPPAVAYVFADGRGTDEIAGQLADFSGILQVDGYAAYKALARGHGGAIQLAFCLAHARRKFVEVYKTTSSPFAHEVIERLQAIYAIEAEIRGSGAEQRLAARRARTAPLMEALKARLTEMVGQLFSQSKLTEAINYALNHWEGLTLFLSDGRVEVDSNTVERSMRPIAMGRCNSLFSGSEGGAESWAILASLVNTAKLHDLDP
jgi:Transposase IS66 family